MMNNARVKLRQVKGRKEIIALVVILLIGAYLRLYRIGEYMTFLGDEGRDMLVVYKMITEADPVFLGPTASVGGFFLGPIYYYFIAPFLWVTNFNPAAAAVMVALFGVATIYLLYQVGKDIFNMQTGLISASLYALSPLVIVHSRASWNPNIVPFFALFFIYSLYKISKTEKIWWFLAAGSAWGIGIQLHYLFSFLLPAGIVYLFLNRKKLNMKNIGLGFAGIIFPLLPFFGFELKNGFPNAKTIINYLTREGDVGFKLESAIGNLTDVAFRSFARLLFVFPPPEQFYRYSESTMKIWRTSIILTVIFAFALFFYQVLRNRENKKILVFLWIFFGYGLFAFYNRDIYDYYFTIFFPLPFLLFGNLLAFLSKRRIGKILIYGVFISVVYLNWNARPTQYPPNRQMQQAEKISSFILKKIEGKPYNFALITSSNSDHAYRFFLEKWGHPPITIENNTIDPNRKTVTDQLFVVCEALPCKPLGHPLWEIAGFGPAEIAGEWEVAPLKVYKLEHYRKLR